MELLNQIHFECTADTSGRDFTDFRIPFDQTSVEADIPGAGPDADAPFRESPEVDTRRKTPLTPGVDYSAYPKSIGFVTGLNLTF